MAGVTASYLLQTSEPELALRAITRGQSVGNPSILTPYETKEFLKKWGATGTIHRRTDDTTYVSTITFPEQNFGTEGVNYLLSVLLGGQCDIDLVHGCRLMELDLGSCARHYPRPRYGVSGLRQQLDIPTRAFVGGILKPKIGLSPVQVADVVKQMADGGCDFIKEDEILADQYWCPMRKRIPLVAKSLQGYSTLYAPCITSDGSHAWKKARLAKECGATSIHCNLWAGLGTFVDIRKHVDLPIFFQKSGDRVWTTGPFSMDSTVLYQLIHLIGCDFSHVGMYGGYLAEPVGVLQKRIQALQTTLPSFSCGMTPMLSEQILRYFGTDVMVTSGGWIHGQAQGITWACQRLRSSVEAVSADLLSRRVVDRSLQTQSAADSTL